MKIRGISLAFASLINFSTAGTIPTASAVPREPVMKSFYISTTTITDFECDIVKTSHVSILFDVYRLETSVLCKQLII